jgi:tetratricopeptide (TPR) repeat protein
MIVFPADLSAPAPTRNPFADSARWRCPVAKKKYKHHGHVPSTPAEIRQRADKAVGEGRFQAALELARELYKREPTPPHQELVVKCYLGRARQLLSQNHARDAVTVLDAARAFVDGNPAWLEQIANELIASGEIQQGMKLLAAVPGKAPDPRALGRAADAALQQEAAGRKLLPEALHADFDRVLRAFEQLTAGQDDAARETMQGIGLRSPFSEWKLLLRGLQAYYRTDDVRALENWQRLDPDRLPARLAAPFRFRIDPGYRQAQPRDAQQFLDKVGDRLQASPTLRDLREIQKALASEDTLPKAFRLAEPLVPVLRQEAPHLVPRLAACFYWAVVTQGIEEDVTRYRRVFGTPADDPQFARLSALAMENLHHLNDAHRFWQDFEKSVEGNPAWPAGQAARVRALVWDHMGRNAAGIPDDEQVKKLPAYLRDHPDRPRPLRPSAEECFQRSIELAPDQLRPYEELFDYYQAHKKPAKAEKVGKQLLERFPEHVPTLEALAGLYMNKGKYDEALDLYQRALRANPLDRRMRGKVSGAHLFRARSHAEAGRFDQARADYQASLAFRDGEKTYPALCKWAAAEFKAGNAERAEELLRQAQAEAGSRLPIAFSMVIEIIRLKLPRTLKSRFDKEFNDALAEPVSAAEAIAVLDTVVSHHVAGVTYHGQKTHEKKVLSYVEKARNVAFTEDQLVEVGTRLLALKSVKKLRTFTRLGETQFPQNPHFPLLEARSYMANGPENCPTWPTRQLLANARRLAEKLPRDPRQQELLEGIRKDEELVDSLNPFGRLFDQGFGGFYDDDDDDDYEDDY